MKINENASEFVDSVEETDESPETNRRASKGFRKHVREQKAFERRVGAVLDDTPRQVRSTPHNLLELMKKGEFEAHLLHAAFESRKTPSVDSRSLRLVTRIHFELYETPDQGVKKSRNGGRYSEPLYLILDELNPAGGLEVSEIILKAFRADTRPDLQAWAWFFSEIASPHRISRPNLRPGSGRFL